MLKFSSSSSEVQQQIELVNHMLAMFYMLAMCYVSYVLAMCYMLAICLSIHKLKLPKIVLSLIGKLDNWLSMGPFQSIYELTSVTIEILQ